MVLVRAATDTVTGTDTASPAITGRVTFTVTPAAADHIAFTLSSGVTVGVPFSITVTVQDVYGNTVTGYTGTVHFQLTGPMSAMADYTFTTADQGSRTFGSFTLNQGGLYTLSGTDAADPTVSGFVVFSALA